MNKEVKIKNLNHLGIIAGIIDDLDIENIVNSLIPPDKREKITAGQIVKAIILNGLGFLSKPLYLFANFFQDKPVEKLLGDGLTSELINDDKIGRVMDKIHKISIELLWTNIGINTLDKFQLNTQFSHLDSTSISLEGKYENYSEENTENIIKINHGYSRDKRPDLKQFMLDLMVTNDGDVPIFMRVGDGNESDKKIFTSFINDFQKNINIKTTYVADSALYTSKNLHKMKDLSWITRVPMTIKKAKEIIRKSLKNQNWNNSDIVGYKYREEKVNYHGIEQRWLIVKSDKREKSDLLKLETKVKKEKEKIEEKLARWAKVKRKNKQDLENEVKTVTEKLKYHQVLEINYREYQNKKEEVSYICEIKIQENQEIIKLEKQGAGQFIIATNVLNKKVLSSEEILKEYKNQQSCERGFRFIKDPLFLASYVFVKNPKRVEVMGMIMSLCLLVYSIGQRMIRKELERKKEKIKNQVNKLTSRPTLRWIFMVFQGIHEIKIDKQNWINIDEEREKILSYFSINCQKYYCN